MSIVIEAAPDGQEQFGESSEAMLTPERELAEKFRFAYHERFANYETDLAGAPFRSVFVVFDEEDEEVVFDFNLYERLLEVYIIEGWAGIVLIEEALDKRLPQTQEYPPVAGTPADARTLWLPAKTFFRFTRNLLALLIRETLVQIERKAAGAIKNTLSRSAEQVEKAWNTDFSIGEGQKLPKSITPLQSKTGKVVMEKFYFFGDRAVSEDLFAALSGAVRQKFAYEEMLRRTARFRQAIEEVRGHLQRTRSRAQPHEKPRLGQGLIQLDMKQAEVQRLTEQSKNLLKSTLSVVHANYPLGLMVLDGLNLNSTREEMEHKLGVALAELRGRIPQVSQRVDPRLSRVAVQIPAVDADERMLWKAIQDWKPPPECYSFGIEGCVVDAAVKRAADDAGWFPLVHEATWHRLVESGTLSKDSFEYVVYAHYVSALIDRIEDERQAGEAFEKFWGHLGRVAAALSLLSLASPATAGFAPVLRGVSVVVDLSLMAHAIYSVVGNLALLDELLAKELIHPDAFALEHLARVGQLAEIRREALDEIALRAALELASMGAGVRWASVKKLTLARGYYSDLETLLADDE